MEEKILITCKEAGELTGFDPQCIHSQIEADIENGCNASNWNALKVGRKILIPMATLKQKLFGPVGPVFTVDVKVADVLAKLKMAKEED